MGRLVTSIVSSDASNAVLAVQASITRLGAHTGGSLNMRALIC